MLSETPTVLQNDTMNSATIRPNQCTSWAAPTPQRIKKAGRRITVMENGHRRCSGSRIPLFLRASQFVSKSEQYPVPKQLILISWFLLDGPCDGRLTRQTSPGCKKRRSVRPLMDYDEKGQLDLGFLLQCTTYSKLYGGDPRTVLVVPFMTLNQIRKDPYAYIYDTGLDIIISLPYWKQC